MKTTIEEVRRLARLGVLSRVAIRRAVMSDGWSVAVRWSEAGETKEEVLATTRGAARVFSSIDTVITSLEKAGLKVDGLLVQ